MTSHMLGEEGLPWGHGPSLQYLSFQFCLLLGVLGFHPSDLVCLACVCLNCLLYHLEDHLDCLQFGAIRSISAMNILTQVL